MIATVPDATQADVDAAVQSARKAFDSGIWSEMPPVERERRLLKLASIIEAACGRTPAFDCR